MSRKGTINPKRISECLTSMIGGAVVEGKNFSPESRHLSHIKTKKEHLENVDQKKYEASIK